MPIPVSDILGIKIITAHWMPPNEVALVNVAPDGKELKVTRIVNLADPRRIDIPKEEKTDE